MTLVDDTGGDGVGELFVETPGAAGCLAVPGFGELRSRFFSRTVELRRKNIDVRVANPGLDEGHSICRAVGLIRSRMTGCHHDYQTKTLCFQESLFKERSHGGGRSIDRLNIKDYTLVVSCWNQMHVLNYLLQSCLIELSSCISTSN